MVQIALGGDAHTARGWRQTSVADSLQEGEGKTAASESPPTTMWLGLKGWCAASGGGSMRKRSGGIILIICDRARKRSVART